MQQFASLCISTYLLTAASVGYCQAPGPGEYHVAYEMPVFTNKQTPQQAGTHLNGPGDSYRYTYFIDNKYRNNEKYYLKKATIGVHIIDDDVQDVVGDTKKEWGSILLNGQALHWIHYPPVKEFRQGQNPERTDLVEIMSDLETAGMPPYIFDVTHLIQQQPKLILEVTNLREDGEINSPAPYGEFTVLRGGLHLYYAEKDNN